MRSSAFLTMTLVVALAGCSAVKESKVNPFNWFGKGRAEKTVATPGPYERADGRILVDQVISLRVNRTPGGAVIEAVGVPPTQGYWFPELVLLNDGNPVDGVLTYEFRVAEPLGNKRQGAVVSREITAGAAISNIKLNGVRQITVVGARQSRSSRR